MTAVFHRTESPTLQQKENFEKAVQFSVRRLSKELPSAVFKKLNQLTALLLKENTITHPQLAKFLDESNTFEANPTKAHAPALDMEVRTAEALITKLYHSSVRQRTAIFKEKKESLPTLISTAEQLAEMAQFISASQLKELLEMGKKRRS